MVISQTSWSTYSVCDIVLGLEAGGKGFKTKPLTSKEEGLCNVLVHGEMAELTVCVCSTPPTPSTGGPSVDSLAPHFSHHPSTGMAYSSWTVAWLLRLYLRNFWRAE